LRTMPTGRQETLEAREKIIASLESF